MGSEVYDVAIIGMGFSGLMVTANLVRYTARPLNILCIDPTATPGLGIAYATTRPEHLLNVRAGNMGAFADDAAGFCAWLQGKSLPEMPTPQCFVSRCLYGAYLGHLWEETLALALRKNCRIVHIRHSATALHREADHYSVTAGDTLNSRNVVLASGNTLNAQAQQTDNIRYTSRPWHYDLATLKTTDSVAIIGSGLTAIDVLFSLKTAGFQGTINLLSRHARFPFEHAAPGAAWPLSRDMLRGDTLSMLLKQLRQQVRLAAERGHSWQQVMDGLRPLTQQLWSDLPTSEQQRFLRCYFGLWNVYRHRMPPQAAALITDMRQCGQLHITAAGVHNIITTETACHIRTSTGAVISTDVVFDCRGINYQKNNTLLESLHQQHLIAAPDNGYGIAVDAQFRAAPGVYALGALTVGSRLEITAVPDLRTAAATVARLIAEAISAACA